MEMFEREFESKVKPIVHLAPAPHKGKPVSTRKIKPERKIEWIWLSSNGVCCKCRSILYEGEEALYNRVLNKLICPDCDRRYRDGKQNTD